MYILKPGKAITTLRGIVSSPRDSKNPTQKEILTAKDFKGGEETLKKLLQSENCSLIKYEKKSGIVKGATKEEKKEENKK